ncbi:MAG: FkbM family methyltransferase [Bacteroidales bacterium]|nr:FkbM family methyltransferase [Bacteroidales bacterium]
MKTFIKLILQKLLGFRNYLYIFSRFIILKLPRDKNEKDFLHFIKLLPPDGTVLDIGANIGVMSYYLARSSPSRNVIAFEPIPYNYDNLLRIKRKFRLDNITLQKTALGNEEGEIEMILPVEHSVRFHGLAHVKDKDTQDKNKGELYRCPVHKLDNLLQDNKDIKGIKIDVENFEFHVLKGAEQLLRKNMPIIYCELWDNENRVNTMQLLTGMGYSVLVLEGGSLEPFEPDKHTTQNFFFKV